jgi:hypothetical protein
VFSLQGERLPLPQAQVLHFRERDCARMSGTHQISSETGMGNDKKNRWIATEEERDQEAALTLVHKLLTSPPHAKKYSKPLMGYLCESQAPAVHLPSITTCTSESTQGTFKVIDE